MQNEILLFSYFKGQGDGLHIAYSFDGYEWNALPDDPVLLHPKAGKECIMRDPCLVFGDDERFHLVWTTGWRENGIGYASSRDLIDWCPQQYLPLMQHEPRAVNCWAPEIFRDPANGNYIVYWSSTIEGAFPETQPFGDEDYNHRIYYVTTRDFRHFSPVRLLYDGGFNVIDAHITAHAGRYILFMKDETLVPPAKCLRMATGNTPYDFGPAGPPITSSHYWAEGPTAMKIGNEWLLYFDKYKVNEMGALRSTDLVTWEDVSHLLSFPRGAQHGFCLRAPAWIVSRLQRARQRHGNGMQF